MDNDNLIETECNCRDCDAAEALHRERRRSLVCARCGQPVDDRAMLTTRAGITTAICAACVTAADFVV